MVEHANGGRIISVDRVHDELARGKDELKVWASQQFENAFAKTDGPVVVTSYRDLITWVQSQPQFTTAAKAEFATGADGWLVAYAKANSFTVATEEQPAPEAKRKVPIPNLCKAFNVPCCGTFAMLRVLGVRFE